MSKSNPTTPHLVVDASGLNCPLPILKARKALMEMHAGQILKVIATDPTSAEDFPVFAKATGNRLITSKQDNNTWEYYLLVGN